MSYTTNHESTDRELFLDVLVNIICQYLDSQPVECDPLLEPTPTELHTDSEAA